MRRINVPASRITRPHTATMIVAAAGAPWSGSFPPLSSWTEEYDPGWPEPPCEPYPCVGRCGGKPQAQLSYEWFPCPCLQNRNDQ